MSAKPLSKSYVWRGIFSILLGLVLIIWPQFTTQYIVTIIGAMLLTVGIILVTVYYFATRGGQRYGLGFPAGALIYLIVGTLLVAMPGTFAAILIVVMGLLLILGAIDQLWMLFQASRRGYRISGLRYIAPAIILVAGIVIAVSPVESMNVMLVLFGITAMLYGIVDLTDQYLVRSTHRQDPA